MIKIIGKHVNYLQLDSPWKYGSIAIIQSKSVRKLIFVIRSIATTRHLYEKDEP